MNPKVNWFFEQESAWKEEYNLLRTIVLECGLTEELKWGVPCYTVNGKNVVLIHGFKEYCALLFHKGVLLSDEAHILIRQTENVQGPRQIRFKSKFEISELKAVLKSYIFEAIKIEKSGAKVPVKQTVEFEVPEEFEKRLNDLPELKKAFEKLTPGRQRAYLLFFSSGKQSKTRLARIEKYEDAILQGKGLDD